MLMVDEILHAYGQRIVSRLKDDIMNKKITSYGSVNASGKLRDSIRYEVDNGILKVYALGYSYFLEHGRKPGKRPPISAIAQWIKDKGIRSEDSKLSVDSLAYLIARKIGTKGTIIHEQGGSDLLSSIINSQLVDELKSDIFIQIVDEAVASFNSDVLKMAA